MKHKFKSQTNLLILLTFLLALPILSTDIYLPSLHEISKFFSTSHQKVQLTLTLYFLTFGVIQLVYGSLSDCFGRKPIMIISLLIYIFGTTICIYSNSITMLILGRCLQALGTGNAILVFAIVRDMYEGNKVARIIAYMSAVVAISPIIAPIFGGYIQSFLSWQWNFIILWVAGVLLLLVSLVLLPETNKYKRVRISIFINLIKDYHKLLQNRYYMKHALGAAFAFGALFSYISGSHYIFLNLMGYSPKLFGLIFAIAAIGYVLGAFLSGKLIPNFGMNQVFAIGLISLVMGAIIMTVLCYFYRLNSVAILIPQIICEFGISVIVPIAVAKALQPIPECAGAGSSLIGFLRFFCASIASILTMQFQGTIALALIILGFAMCAFLSIGVKIHMI